MCDRGLTSEYHENLSPIIAAFLLTHKFPRKLLSVDSNEKFVNYEHLLGFGVTYLGSSEFNLLSAIPSTTGSNSGQLPGANTTGGPPPGVLGACTICKPLP